MFICFSGELRTHLFACVCTRHSNRITFVLKAYAFFPKQLTRKYCQADWWWDRAETVITYHISHAIHLACKLRYLSLPEVFMKHANAVTKVGRQEPSLSLVALRYLSHRTQNTHTRTHQADESQLSHKHTWQRNTLLTSWLGLMQSAPENVVLLVLA